MRQVVLVGGSGLVGGEVAARLAARDDVELTALVRRQGSVLVKLPEPLRARVRELVFAFDDPQAYASLPGALRGEPIDALLCCVGTTLRAAGSKAAFLAVDRDIPRRLIECASRLAHRPTFGLVSSAGADRPLGFYLATKAAVERMLVQSGLAYVIVRPSLLLGPRPELRVGERLAALTLPAVYAALAAAGLDRHALVARLRPIAAGEVAVALVARTLALAAGVGSSAVLEGRELAAAGAGATATA